MQNKQQQKQSNQAIYKQANKPLFISLPPEQQANEWAKVLEMRRTKHPLISGGKNKKKINCADTHKAQRKTLKRHICIFCNQNLFALDATRGVK